MTNPAAPQNLSPAPGLNPVRIVLLLATPAAILMGALIGWLVLTSFGFELFVRELRAAAVINLFGGLLAVLPMILLLSRGRETLARMALASISIRMVVVLIGLLLALGPGWRLHKNPLVIWTASDYLAVMVAESIAAAWVLRR